jgi:hypothetical protein
VLRQQTMGWLKATLLTSVALVKKARTCGPFPVRQAPHFTVQLACPRIRPP